MKTRESLQNLLETICENVYFRAPSEGMKYPCIKYDLAGRRILHADNVRYMKRNEWNVTIIDENPDSEIPELLEEKFPYCRLGKPYQANGLNHFPYTLYY